MNSKGNLRGVLGLLDVGLLPLVVKLGQLQLERARERDDGRAGIVRVDVLLDLGQPETKRELK
jgi:hypothetical protein